MAEPIEPPITISKQAADDLEAYNSAKVSLAEYCAKGTAEYAQKRYEDAVDHYAQASELQAEINGEMSPENAEILFLYGRALFKVAQQQSDVLGGRASGEKQKPKKKSSGKKVDTIKEGDEKAEAVKAEGEENADQVAEEMVATLANGGAEKKGESSGTDSKKPLFTFTGDENFEDSDEEEEEERNEDDEEEDPLNLAFDILDLTRVLFEKRLQADESEGKGKETGDNSMTTHIKERLADTRDLLGEISLENER